MELRFRLGELLGSDSRCAHLDEAELIALVEGRLSADRLRVLAEHSVDCASCAGLVEDIESFHKLTSSGVTIPSEREAFLASNDRIRRLLGLTSTDTRVRSWFLWLAPAIVAGLFIAIVFFPTRGLLIQEIDRLPLVAPPSVRAYDGAERWRGIERAWSSGDWRAASLLLEQVVERTPDDASAWFYLGYARLLAGSAAAAIEPLTQADQLEAETPSEHTRWMLAAALDRAGRQSEACAMLKSVEKIDGKRSEAAGVLVAGPCATRQSEP